MNQSIVTILRNKKTTTAAFRRASDKLTHFLAQEALQHMREKQVPLETPIAKTKGAVPDQKVMLVPILRAGLALLPIFLTYFEEASVGFIGLKRDEKTFVPMEYYRNFPSFDGDTLIIILDPMLATGGSASATVNTLLGEGAQQEQILLVNVVSAPEGIDRLKKDYPGMKRITAFTDEKLNDDAFIVPGLGDYGDRYFNSLP